MGTRASLDDSAVLLELRRRLIDCYSRARRALESIEASVQRAEVWLRDERARPIAQQVLRDETRFSETKIALMEAKTRIGDQLPRTHETEERDFRRARAQLEETEAVMRRIKQWLIRMPRELTEPVAQVRRVRYSVEDLGPKAVAHLDVMIEAIEKYQSAHTSDTKGQS